MRTRVLLSALLLALVALSPAQGAGTATFKITITKAGFNPSAVTIGLGDTVTWTNTDTSPHQVDSNRAGFTSPLLNPGASYSFVYNTAGKFAYSDAVVKRLKGSVTVSASGAVAVTQTAAPALVVYGGAVTLSGSVSNRRAGETVTVFAKPQGQNQFTSVGSATSTPNGNWSFIVKPRLQTAYEARWRPSGPTVASPQTVVNVRPQVGFRVKGATGRVVTFFTKVRGARSFAGKRLAFQRRNSVGRWVTLKRVTLTSTSSATFRSRLPRGRSRVRLFMPLAQTAPGYVAGISRVLVLSR
jgi:plastocyanin